MKRFFIFLLISVLLIGTLSAQDRTGRQREISTTSISGTLKLERGFVAVQSDDTVYRVPMLTRYIGFVDGLKEGTSVTIEGYAFRNIIHPVKFTIDGKSYDLIAGGPRAGFGMRNDNAGPGRHNVQPRQNNQRQNNPRSRGNFAPNNRRFGHGCPCGCFYYS